MFIILRHLLAILLLPFMVVVVVPYGVINSLAIGDTRFVAASLLLGLFRSLGALLFAAGFGLFGWCVSLFVRVGRGTLAPWDPTRHLVGSGPYRFVRNPMISGVVLMLAGQALFWGSGLMGAWACAFVLINHLYFVLSEEPGLERRFGENYRAYKAAVPRWIPRIRRGLDN